jgi:hypothetical protein
MPQLALRLEARGLNGIPVRYGVGRPGTFISRKISPIERWLVIQVTEGTPRKPILEFASPEEALAALRRQQS